MEFNLADLFEAVADTVPEAEALVCGDGSGIHRRQTYEQLERRANQAAHALAAVGIGPGDTVGLHLHNGHPFIELMLACYKLRAIPVNVNYRYVADELAYLFDDAGLAVLCTEPEMAAEVEAVRGRVTNLHTVIQDGDDYESRLAAQPESRPEVAGRSADDRYLLYTGGTTGPPKGVEWRHEDIYFASLGGRGTPSQGRARAQRPPTRSSTGCAEAIRSCAGCRCARSSTAGPCGWRCRPCSTAAPSCSTPAATSTPPPPWVCWPASGWS